MSRLHDLAAAALRTLDPEDAHRLTVRALALAGIPVAALGVSSSSSSNKKIPDGASIRRRGYCGTRLAIRSSAAQSPAGSETCGA